jgi:predicted HTH domain antitoxin
MTLLLELPDSWKSLLGLDTGDAVGRARQMLVIEGYREGRLSRGQAAEMLNLGFHEVEELFSRVGAAQQPTWDEMELSGKNLRAIQGR